MLTSPQAGLHLIRKFLVVKHMISFTSPRARRYREAGLIRWVILSTFTAFVLAAVAHIGSDYERLHRVAIEGETKLLEAS